jgi:hypothetical protein
VSPVDELPVGTVTFLFTDIEGSTRLLKQLRDRPIVPTDKPRKVAFVAKRVGSFPYHPEWGVLLDQRWLK